MTAPESVLAQTAAAFRDAYSADPALAARAPGRVNLIGEHTDYNDGFVLPCAIGFETVVAIGPSDQPGIEVMALEFENARDRFDPAAPIAPLAQGAWQNHVRGVAAELARRGIVSANARLAIGGNVPQGAGLSSSASLGVAAATALAAFAGQKLDPTLAAKVAHASENDFVGCACGIMDQLVSARADAGSALLIDCRTLATRPVPVPDGLAIVIVHSGVERGLVDSAYNERRRQCEAAAGHFGVAALRDLDAARLEADRGTLDDTVFRRACHVVTENDRVRAFVDALRSADLDAMAALMAASHASMRDDFEITVPAIDDLVALIVDTLGGRGGARMTGGGFGGCVVAILPKALTGTVRDAVERGYRTPAGGTAAVTICEPARGAELLQTW
ncbi:galactokinase [Parasphingopyxis algicola]|uniref:galactokinase n=1 Tax=Parasphingopyxis algicola TaxID=2026624 RepID=UPI0015A3A27F|nr:galactokinase [Parasphingopyxis algicola]QLC25358.1 galactokinase [Parasphingopyxis algicola]